MVREIITIDEELCNGCGECVPGCPEGALRIIDGKARLVGDFLCDGLGACLGECPTGALSVERREAEPYDEATVMESMLPMGVATVIAHLEHLKDHNEKEYLRVALSVIEGSDSEHAEEIMRRWNDMSDRDRAGAEGGPRVQVQQVHGHGHGHGHGHAACPGSAARSFSADARETVAAEKLAVSPAASALSHWPVQMHLINPASPHFAGSDFVLAADCTAYAFGAFHPEFLQGKTLGIACPKLDRGVETYVEKVRALIDDAKINTLTVVIMQVPCCGGLLHVAQTAVAGASRKVPVKQIVVGVEGDILDESWV